MTTETFIKAQEIDREIRNLSLANIKDATDIIPTSINYSFNGITEDGRRQCTTTIPLSNEFQQILSKLIEERITILKKRMKEL